MMSRHTLTAVACLAAALVSMPDLSARQHAVRQATDGRPEATVDLRTREGAALVSGQWRYSDARLTEIEFNSAGTDMKPTGRPVKTLDQAVKAAEWTSTIPNGRGWIRQPSRHDAATAGG